MKMPAKSKRDAAEAIRTTDKRAVQIMAAQGCSFSQAYAMALDEATNSQVHRTG